MVDVAHDGDDGRARQQARRIVGGIEHAFFDVGLGDAAHGMAEFLGEKLRGIGVDRVGDLRHMALFHQEPNHVDGALGHAVGQLLDRDRLRNGHFADDLFLRLAVAMPGHALDAAAEGGDRTFALLVGGKGGDDGEPSAAFFRGSAGRLGGGRRTRRRAAAADAPRRFLLVGFERRARARLRCRRGIGAEALLGDLVGLAFGFFVVLAALFLVAFARFRLRTSERSASSRLWRMRASSSAILRSSASRRRASASACARALRSSSVKVRSTTPEGLGEGQRCRAPAWPTVPSPAIWR